MVDKKDFRSRVMEVIKKNGGDCAVCSQYISGNGGMSFANMRGIRTSWGKNQLLLFTPKEITFTIPYEAVKSYNLILNRLEIELSGSRLVSIREIQ